MKHFDQRRLLIGLVALAGLAAVAVFAYRTQASGGEALQASGTVEAIDVLISPETAGRVAEVLVEKGALVKAGDALLRLDDALLQAQRVRAEAAWQAAQANLAAAQDGEAAAGAALKSAQVGLEAAQAAAEAERLPVQKALDDLAVNAPALRGEAARSVAAANRAVRDAVYMLDNFTVSSLQKDLSPSQGISQTKQLLDEARAAFEPFRNESQSSSRRETLKDNLDNAQSEYDSAVRRIELNAALEAAQARLHKVEDDLNKLKDGPNPQDVAILEARLQAIDAAPRQAQTAVEAALVGVQTSQSRIQAAQAAVAQAQAELALLELQLQKLTITAPVEGVVLTRSVEAGEVLAPGSAVMSIGRVAQLKITVYLPEDRYGQVRVGQTAQVSVDAFPGQLFPATVAAIADQAEFTPRNVQTAEGRRNTVFAIELRLDNPQDKLKPGMPADVSFGN